MTTAKPKWFIANQHYNQISHRTLTAFEGRNPQMFSLSRMAFPTWIEAHAWLIEHRTNQVERARKDLASAERSLAKARLMRPKGEA